MSNDKTATPAPSVITVADPAPESTEETVEKQSFVQKTKHFVSTHKRPALAVAGLVGLVGVAAVAGRKTAPLPDLSVTLELEPPHASIDVETSEEESTEDTTVA